MFGRGCCCCENRKVLACLEASNQHKRENDCHLGLNSVYTPQPAGDKAGHAFWHTTTICALARTRRHGQPTRHRLWAGSSRSIYSIATTLQNSCLCTQPKQPPLSCSLSLIADAALGCCCEAAASGRQGSSNGDGGGQQQPTAAAVTTADQTHRRHHAQRPGQGGPRSRGV